MSFSNENQALISLGASHPHQQPLRDWPRVPMRPGGDVSSMSDDALAMMRQLKKLVATRKGYDLDYKPQLGWNRETGEPTLAIRCYAPGKQNSAFSCS
jgi:hypothetical protein